MGFIPLESLTETEYRMKVTCNLSSQVCKCSLEQLSQPSMAKPGASFKKRGQFATDSDGSEHRVIFVFLCSGQS